VVCLVAAWAVAPRSLHAALGVRAPEEAARSRRSRLAELQEATRSFATFLRQARPCSEGAFPPPLSEEVPAVVRRCLSVACMGESE
jgi:hypothetical protein